MWRARTERVGTRETSEVDDGMDMGFRGPTAPGGRPWRQMRSSIRSPGQEHGVGPVVGLVLGVVDRGLAAPEQAAGAPVDLDGDPVAFGSGRR